ANFAVTAASEQVARSVGEKAESERKRLAILWFGTDQPRWEAPCKVVVTLAPGKKATGVCVFSFEQERPFAPSQQRWLAGESTADLLPNALPQQIMHTLVIYEFGVNCPRWIQDGAGLVAQSEKARNDRLATLAKDTADVGLMPLVRCFARRDYPTAVEAWYA